MAELTFRGEPYAVDEVLWPLLSGARWVFGALSGALVWWLGWLWWVPVPVVLATVALEGWLFLRSDRPIRIRIADDRLVVDDRYAPTLTIHHDAVHALTILHQPRALGATDGHEVVLVLASERRVLLAIACQLARLPPLPSHAVAFHEVDCFLGARAGLLRAVGGRTRIVRQRVHDAGLAAALTSWVPEAAAGRRALRLWRGAEPDLSPFGLHPGDPDALLVLEDEGWALHGDAETRRGPRRCEAWTVWQRDASLFGIEPDRDAVALLPLLVLVLVDVDGNELRVAVPAPGRTLEHPDQGSRELEGLHHTHAPEGAILLAWLDQARQLPRDLQPLDHEPATTQGDTPHAAPPGAPG